MVKEVLLQELNDLFSGYLEAKGFELVDLVHQFSGAKMVLTVLADRPQGDGLASAGQSHRSQGDGLGGITLQECAWVCKELKNLLEEKNMIAGDYVLGVSSPGLDRPLKSKRDFLRSLNKEAVFFLNDPVGGKLQWQGVIYKVEDTRVFIQAVEMVEIPFTKINKAQLVI